MPAPQAPPDSNPYGASHLHRETQFDISSLFNPEGSTAMPLGHNDNSRGLGYGFDIGPGGMHKGHALTIGRTRGGKNVSVIVPALLTYKGSMVVIDPKGENAWLTAERRRQLGQRVVILDHWNEVNRHYGSKVGVTEPVTKFNPLSALDPNSPDFADDVTAIADAFILQTGNDPHWSDSARELVGGIIAAEVIRNPGKASMRDVRKLIAGTIKDLRLAVERIVKDQADTVAADKLAAIVEVDDEGKPVSSREIASIRSTARTQTGFLSSPQLLDGMETDDAPFNLEDLATGNVTLYLVLPADKLKSHGRWLRMILTLAIRAIARQAKRPDPPCLFVLDELGTISPGSGLSMVEQSYGLMAGLGIRIWAFLQDLSQLKRDYPQSWETFISNSSIVQLLNVGDETTAQYFSAYLGNGTINAKTGGQSLKVVKAAPDQREEVLNELVLKSSQGSSLSERQHRKIAEESYEKATAEGKHFKMERWVDDQQLQARPVLYPWEVREVDESTSIIICPGKYNMQLKRFVYYSDPVFSSWARHDPNQPAPVVVRPPAPAPVANTNVPTPANTNTPPPPVTAASIASDLGKAAGGFLKRKLEEKLTGR